MAIPSVNVFSNLLGGPLANVMDARNKFAKNRLETKYYAPNIESEINQRNALTQGQNIKNQYMPDELRLANALSQLRNQYYGPNAQSEINQRNALTNKSTTMLPLEAKELELKNEWYPKTEQATINWKNSGGSGAGVDQKQLMGLQNQLSIEHPDWSPLQANQAASAYLSGDDQLPDGTPLPPPSGIARDFLNSRTKKTNTAQALNQQRFAATTDSLLKEGKKLLPSVSQYSGALGKGKGSIDSVKSSLGENTPAYNDYMYFTRQYVPTVASEMMRAFGVNASDTQKSLYQKVINPLAWDQNPKGAEENFNRMVDMFEKAVSPTIGKGIAQINAGLRKQGSINQDIGREELSPITDEDIDLTAKENGMTREQVIKRLKSEGRYNG